ncbi:neuropeptide receptor npr-1-like [Argopecten irradians]|uniref:neuropeptide receptor npr-1-like n=1 Tax=Argopecten irradians TaxID=31199 RepID=UPI003713B20B
MDNRTMPEYTLDDLNARLAGDLLPSTVLLFVYILLGLFGNVVVVYIYTFQLRNSSTDRFFIPHLAGIDAVTCVICSSANIIINLNPVKYTNPLLCKSFYMLSQFSASSSALTLTVVAVYRFLLVCRPYKPKMTLRAKQLSVYLTLFVMFLLSLPSLFTTGIVPITDKRLNVTGYVCASVNVMGSRLFPFIYNVLVLTFALVNVMILSILYVMIGRTIYKRMKLRKGHKIKTVGISPSSDGISETCIGETSTISNLASSATMTSVPQSNHTRNMRTAGRRSITFLVISFVYILCFVPTLIAMVQSSVDKNDWSERSETVALRIANTFYIVNNIVNPVIYGVFDKTIRGEMVSCFFNICSVLKS